MNIIQSLLELQVNGTNINDDEDNFDIDDTIDDTENVPSGDTVGDPAPEVEAPDESNDDDNFTIEDEDDVTDDTVSDTENSNSDEDTENNDVDANSDDDNFTIEDDASNNTDEKENSETSDENQKENDSKEEEKQPSNPTDSIDDDEKRAAEEAIYDSLTDDQKRIRILQLKLDYRDLYETMVNTVEGVNNIPKNANNLETIKRLNVLLTKAKTILISYIKNNFDQCTYLENYTTYLKYLAIFRTTTKVIEEINSKEYNK